MPGEDTITGNASQPKEWLTVLVSYLLVSAMMACMVATIIQLGEVLAPGWDGAYLVLFCLILSIEALYSHRQLRSMDFSDPRWLSYRAAELVLAMVTLKVMYYLVNGPVLLVSDLPLWREDFLPAFFTNEYLFGFFTGMIVWFASTRLGNSLVALEVDQRLIKIEAETGIYEARDEIRWDLVNDILFIGIGMILLSALLRYDPFLSWAEIPRVRAGAYNTLIFFFLALVLLSITQFNIMRARWLRDSLPVQGAVARRWVLYSGVSIFVVTVVAGVLPTRYTVGILTVLNYLFFILAAILNLLVTILLMPILMLLGFLIGLLGNSDAQQAENLQVPKFTPPPPVFENEPVLWLELAKSILFWLVLLAVLGYSVIFFFREHRGLLEKLRRIPFFPYLERLWEWLCGWIGGVNRQITAAMDGGLQRLRSRLARADRQRSFRYISLRRLSPREKVLFYYLAMVRRGGERGVERKASQTPFEYSETLASSIESIVDTEQRRALSVDGVGGDELVDRHADVDRLSESVAAMTDKFVEARYSLHPVNKQDASLAQRYWRRIRRALRKRLHLEDQ